jgi:hypothetical protein
LSWIDALCRGNQASQELLVFQARCEAFNVGEKASSFLPQECKTYVVDVLFPPRSGLLQRAHDVVKEPEEGSRLIGGQESLSAHGICIEAGKTLLRAKK